MNGPRDEIDGAMERLRARSWRVPNPDPLFLENAMRNSDGRIVSFVRTHRIAAAAGALVIAGGAVGGVIAAKSHRATLVGPGGVKEVTLTPQADGTHHAVMPDGTTVVFAPAPGGGGQVTVELSGEAADKGVATVELNTEKEKKNGG